MTKTVGTEDGCHPRPVSDQRDGQWYHFVRAVLEAEAMIQRRRAGRPRPDAPE
jgi:hypothetical protein